MAGIDKIDKQLKALHKQVDNRRCFNCESLGTTYVVPQYRIFVCTSCSGVHMKVGQRVKSLSMAKFTVEELQGLQEGGNENVGRRYLAKWRPDTDVRKPVDRSEAKVSKWIKSVLVDKQFYGEPSEVKVEAPSDTGSVPMFALSSILQGSDVKLKVNSSSATLGSQKSLSSAPSSSSAASIMRPPQTEESLMDVGSVPSSAPVSQAGDNWASFGVSAANNPDPFGDVFSTPATSKTTAIPTSSAALAFDPFSSVASDAPAPSNFDPFAAVPIAALPVAKPAEPGLWASFGSVALDNTTVASMSQASDWANFASVAEAAAAPTHATIACPTSSSSTTDLPAPVTPGTVAMRELPSDLFSDSGFGSTAVGSYTAGVAVPYPSGSSFSYGNVVPPAAAHNGVPGHSGQARPWFPSGPQAPSNMMSASAAFSGYLPNIVSPGHASPGPHALYIGGPSVVSGVLGSGGVPLPRELAITPGAVPQALGGHLVGMAAASGVVPGPPVPAGNPFAQQSLSAPASNITTPEPQDLAFADLVGDLKKALPKHSTAPFGSSHINGGQIAANSLVPGQVGATSPSGNPFA